MHSIYLGVSVTNIDNYDGNSNRRDNSIEEFTYLWVDYVANVDRVNCDPKNNFPRLTLSVLFSLQLLLNSRFTY